MLVSVIITNFNYAAYLERALRSAMNQSLPRKDYEIILIDDASTDNSKLIFKKYKKEIHLIELSENKGLAEVRNIGIRESKGMFVLFLDADDYIHYDLLKVLSVCLVENNRLDAVAVDYFMVNKYGDHTRRISSEKKPIACGIMFRKDLLFNIGLYDKNFKLREEEDLRFRFLKKYNIFHLPLPLYRYRKHGKNMTGNKNLMRKYSALLKKKHAG